MRWHNYVLLQNEELRQFWQAHLAEPTRNVLCILAGGFDPRMCQGIELILRSGGNGRRDVRLIQFDEGPTSPSQNYRVWIQHNLDTLHKLMNGRGAIAASSITMRSPEGRRIESHSALSVFHNLTELADYTDIVLDISAMPRAVYFPLIGKILYLLDAGRRAPKPLPVPNFHLLVAESPELDASIREQGVEDDASYVHPFTGGLDRESSAQQPKVWLPLLGEGQRVQFQKIHDLITPDEICPVLPSPARNARRADDLVMEYRELLFDRLRVEPRNFIYAAERNPYEVYRQVRSSIADYALALAPLGGSKFVISALSSKLMSVGALLAAYELKSGNIGVGIAHVACHGYVIDGAPESASLNPNVELFGLWLAGDCDEP
jgi:hypothetical protein